MNIQQPQFRAGLVGAGYVSEFHIRALRRLPDVQLVGITDLDRARAQAVAERFGIERVFGTMDEMIAAGVDVVHILTPPDSHAELTIRALHLGCHVLVEKPLATRPEDCDAIAEAARVAGKSVGVDHALLYDFFVARALNIVRSGAVGQVVSADYFRSQEYPPYPGGPLPPQYRQGGYPFRDIGVHALYLMEAFLGPLVDVAGQFSTRGGDANLLYDEWQAIVRCQRGTGHIHLSWNIRPFQNLLIVQGTRGVLRADMFGMHVTTRRTTRLPKYVEYTTNALREALQVCTQVPLNFLRIVRGKIMRYHGLQMLVEDFYRSLAQRAPSPVPPEQCRALIDWTERVARPADRAKTQMLARLPTRLTAPILLTGAGGFIGGRVLRRLLDEHERVRVFVRRAPSQELLNDPRVEVVVGDLGDPAAVDRAVEGVQSIYHVGAAIRGSAADFHRGTVAGTRNIVDSALRHQVARMVYISSLSVLHAAASRGGPVTEDWPLEPFATRRGAYTLTKLQAEQIVTEAVRQHGLPAVILRPGLVIGPGAPLLSPAVGIRARDKLIIFGNGKGILPLVYVDDVVDAIMTAGRRDDLFGRVIHLVDPSVVRQNDLARAYIEGTDQSLSVIHMPRIALYSLALGVQSIFTLLRRPAPLSVYRVRSALSFHAFDCRRASRDLDWQPRVGITGGIRQTLEALQPSRPDAPVAVTA